MLRRIKRYVDACASAEFARPLAGTVDDDLARDLAAAFIARPGDTADMPVVASYSAHFHALEDLRPAHSCALRERLRKICGIGLAVAGYPHGACQIVGTQDRRELLRVTRRDEVELDAEAFRARHLPLDQRNARWCLRDIETAALLPPRREPCFRFERRVQLDPIAAHPRCVPSRTGLSDKASCVPCRAAGQLALFEKDNVGDTELGQMIGGRCPRDAATHHYDARARRDGHRRLPAKA